jgi:hypothetical protein
VEELITQIQPVTKVLELVIVIPIWNLFKPEIWAYNLWLAHFVSSGPNSMERTHAQKHARKHAHAQNSADTILMHNSNTENSHPLPSLQICIFLFINKIFPHTYLGI